MHRPWVRRTMTAMTSPDSPFVPPAAGSALPDAVERVAAAAVGVVTRRHAASGIVWRPGLVVASLTALWRTPRAQIVLPGGEAVTGTLRGTDAGSDVALLAFEGGNVAPLRAEAARPVRVGDFVFAVGREP